MPVYPQVLQYMRTNCSIEQTEVVAVVLEDLASATTSSCTSIKANIEAQGMGWTKKITKDFLLPGSSSTRICRGVNAKKRKCCGIKLSALPQELQAEIRSSIFNYYGSFLNLLLQLAVQTLRWLLAQQQQLFLIVCVVKRNTLIHI